MYKVRKDEPLWNAPDIPGDSVQQLENYGGTAYNQLCFLNKPSKN